MRGLIDGIATLSLMTLRRALPADMPFIIEQEQKFRELGFVGGDDARTHERQLADPDCLYLLIEVEGAPEQGLEFIGIQRITIAA